MAVWSPLVDARDPNADAELLVIVHCCFSASVPKVPELHSTRRDTLRICEQPTSVEEENPAAVHELEHSAPHPLPPSQPPHPSVDTPQEQASPTPVPRPHHDHNDDPYPPSPPLLRP